jgi:hypothetical protein
VNLVPTVSFAEAVLQMEMVTATGNLFQTVLFAETVLQSGDTPLVADGSLSTDGLFGKFVS